MPGRNIIKQYGADEFYHVYSRGNERKEIFRSSEDYELFLWLLKDCAGLFDCLVHAWCLMPNHFHLLLETKDSNLSQVMKRLLGVYTMRFNSRYKRRGHLFQGRYKALLVDKDNYFLQLSRYIHLNPVKARLVKLAEDYRWSSMKYFLNEKAPGMLERQFTLNSFASLNDYRRFVLEGVGDGKDDIPKPVGGLFYSGEEFIEKFKKQLSKNKSRDFSGKRDLFKTSETELEKHLFSQEKDFQIYCLWRFARLRQKEIGGRFSITDSAVCHSIKRFEDRLSRDRTLEDRIKILKSRIQFSGTDP